jgi:CheY-like chemotaxis protein
LRLGDLVKEILKMTREVFPKNLTILNEIPPDLWLVSGNPTHLHQVLMNLSVNARDAMPQGGTLAYRGQNITIDENDAERSALAKPGPYVVVQVRDTGCGIPAHLLDKIFDPFFTTKEVGKGTGLGLSTVQGIVRSHGGFVEVDSREGRGTEFRVFLPAIPTGEAAPTAPPAELLERGSGQTILIVDDEPAVRNLLRKTLERFGYLVLCAADGNEALAVHGAHQAQIAAVLTDLAMPGMNGLALTRRLLQINPELPVLVATGQADKDQRSALTAAGVQLLLDKPFRTTALLAALREALTQ